MPNGEAKRRANCLGMESSRGCIDRRVIMNPTWESCTPQLMDVLILSLGKHLLLVGRHTPVDAIRRFSHSLAIRGRAAPSRTLRISPSNLQVFHVSAYKTNREVSTDCCCSKANGLPLKQPPQTPSAADYRSASLHWPYTAIPVLVCDARTWCIEIPIDVCGATKQPATGMHVRTLTWGARPLKFQFNEPL
jgi:hypothetical protein